MEELLKKFGDLLGIQNLHLSEGQMLRLKIGDLGDLDLLYQQEWLLMRLTKSISFYNTELFLDLLTATHYRYSQPPMHPWFQKPDRIGLGFIFLEQETTAVQLYQGLEKLTTELQRRCA